jgi:large subunit ribosomal protein L21
MYAVIRAGGKQYRVSPGDVIEIGQVVEHGRGDKVLVFHYKRKKQYKKLNGHRQPYTAVKITGISVDGKDVTA